MQNVTPRQLEILQFVRNFRVRAGYSPTMQEIGDHLGLTKVTVFEHIGALERKGALLRGAKHRARSLQVAPDYPFPDDRPTRLPLLGRLVHPTYIVLGIVPGPPRENNGQPVGVTSPWELRL